jgi:AraC-like DNA-binding protein
MILFALTGLARDLVSPAPLEAALDGRLQEAITLARTGLDARQPTGCADAVERAVLCADLMLALDREVEAEECYRLAVKAAVASPRGQVRVVSCRNTGLLSLHQQRYAIAESCFRRVIDDVAATPSQRIEAKAALAMSQRAVGNTAAALRTLNQARCEFADLPSQAGRRLSGLIDLLRVELLSHQWIRSHPQLQDHVFWQSDLGFAPADCNEKLALAAIAAARAEHGHPLLMTWLDHRASLVRAVSAGQKGDAWSGMQKGLSDLRRSGLAGLERQERFDSALVAIALRDADLARALIEPLCQRSAQGGRWSLELSYCQARVCDLAGRSHDSLRHYQHYALQSVQCLRMEGGVAAAMGRDDAPGAAKDDVEMRLPAKYRRGYRYLMSHLDQALSVREVADQIGVTERSLQSVFRRHIGMTPAEVIRRNRVERIREDLLQGDATGRTLLEAGARWGISNRSTLVASYRRHFSETPAETLLRSGSPVVQAAVPMACPA